MKFLLLEDVDADGWKFDSSLVERNKVTKIVTLLRGALLVRDDQSQQLAFRSVAPPGELVVCPTESLARLTERQFALLLPLQSSSDRFRAYHESLFEAEESFKVNSKVFVHIKDNREFPGVILYEGIVESLGKGTMFGVELLAEPPQGNVDGSMHGNSYFSCPTNCGIFVSFDKLRLCRDESEFAKKAIEACRGSAERLQKANEKQKQHQMQTRSKSQKKKEEKTEATIGTRVMFFSDSGQTFNGTIRWMGKAYYPAPGQPGQILKPIVGIEADSLSAGIAGLGGISSQRGTQFETRHGGHKVYLPLESVFLLLPEHKQRDFRDEELGSPGSRVEQLAETFARRLPIPVRAIETGRVSGSSSLNLPANFPVELRRGMETKDIFEEQKQLLAEAARKKKDGQPVGSASGIDDSKGDYSYVQRQQNAIFEKAKSQETRPGKTNSMESLPNQKGNYQWFGSQRRPQNDGEYEVVKWPPEQASATDCHSMRRHDCGIHPDLEICSGGQVQLSKGETLNTTMGIDIETTFAASDEIKRLRELLRTAQAEKSQLNARLQTAEKERKELEVKLADSVKERDEMLSDERAKVALMQKENHQLRKQIVNDSQLHDQQNAWFKKKLSMVKSENKEYKKRIDEMAELSQINLDSVSVSKRKLGGGSFGDVHLGMWHGLPVAVKQFYKILESPHNKKLFMQELSVSTRIRHPNIVHVCGTTVIEGNPIQIVMELLEASMSEVFDAAHRHEAGYLTCREQIDLAEGTCCGIAYMHQLKPTPCIHCDIRPSNVMITRGMAAKVGDLGAAHFLGASTSAGGLSANYLAPERLDGRNLRSTIESDICSLGVTVAEIFSGQGAIVGQRHRQLNAIPNAALAHICFQAIAEEPSDRIMASDFLALIQEQKSSQEYSSCPPRRMVLGKSEQDKVRLV